MFMKNFSKITAVQAAGSGDIFHGDIVLEVLLDIGYRFFYIEIPKAVARAVWDRSGRADKAVNEEVEMPYQMKRGRFLMIDNIQHF